MTSPFSSFRPPPAGRVILPRRAHGTGCDDTGPRDAVAPDDRAAGRYHLFAHAREDPVEALAKGPRPFAGTRVSAELGGDVSLVPKPATERPPRGRVLFRRPDRRRGGPVLREFGMAGRAPTPARNPWTRPRRRKRSGDRGLCPGGRRMGRGRDRTGPEPSRRSARNPGSEPSSASRDPGRAGGGGSTPISCGALRPRLRAPGASPHGESRGFLPRGDPRPQARRAPRPSPRARRDVPRGPRSAS